MYPKNKRGAIAALLFAGGLWAYQNRDKIQGWFNNQRSQFNQRNQQSMPMQPHSGPFTGETRRMDDIGTIQGEKF